MMDTQLAYQRQREGKRGERWGEGVGEREGGGGGENEGKANESLGPLRKMVF